MRTNQTTLFYLIRHGESAWNREGRLQGHRDIPLTAEGRRQAALLARRLAGEVPLHGGWAAIYTSDLARARETAEAIGRQLGLAPIPRAELRERAFGPWEGLTREDLAQRYPAEFAAWTMNPVETPIAGVEEAESVTGRGRRLLLELHETHRGRRVLVVTHGAMISRLVEVLLGEPRPGLRLDNTGVTVLGWDGTRAQLVSLNDASHLEPA